MRGMPHSSLTKQRSPWVADLTKTVDMGGVTAHWFTRLVSDGVLYACVSQEPHGWHMSISFRNKRGELTRYPSWDEQFHAVRELLPPELTYAMIIPPDDEYVNAHSTTFHWHEIAPDV